MISNDELDRLDEKIEIAQSKLTQIKIVIGAGVVAIILALIFIMAAIVTGNSDVTLPAFFLLPGGLALIYFYVYRIDDYGNNFPELKDAQRKLKKAQKAKVDYILENG